MTRTRRVVAFVLFALATCAVAAQEKSVKPGINDPFKNPDVEKFAKTFEGESREVFLQSEKVVKACELKPGWSWPTSVRYRVVHPPVRESCRPRRSGVRGGHRPEVPGTRPEDEPRRRTEERHSCAVQLRLVDLPANSVDAAFICDTYHHFEFPEKTMALAAPGTQPGGLDRHRLPPHPGHVPTDVNHVRAGQEVVEKEIASFGFKKTDEVKDLFKDNYFVIFTKPAKADAPPANRRKPVSPVVPGYGAVVRPGRGERHGEGEQGCLRRDRLGERAGQPLPGLARAATLLNLAGSAVLKASDLEIVMVLTATRRAWRWSVAYKRIAGPAHRTRS